MRLFKHNRKVNNTNCREKQTMKPVFPASSLKCILNRTRRDPSVSTDAVMGGGGGGGEGQNRGWGRAGGEPEKGPFFSSVILRTVNWVIFFLPLVATLFEEEGRGRGGGGRGRGEAAVWGVHSFFVLSGQKDTHATDLQQDYYCLPAQRLNKRSIHAICKFFIWTKHQFCG